MNIVSRFFAKVRQKLFVARVDREIFFGVFEQLQGEADHGYPFTSDDELFKVRLAGSLNLKNLLCDVDRAASRMPQSQGEAFRYIFARDIDRQMRLYLNYAKQRESSQCDQVSLQPQPSA